MQDNIRKAGENQAAATCDDLNKYLLSVGRKTVTTTKKKYKGWHWYSREKKLSPVIAKQNTLLHWIKTTPKVDSKIKIHLKVKLKQMQQHENDQIKLAKSRYCSNLANGVHDMPFNPRLAWQYAKLLAKEDTAHSNVAVNVAMKNGRRITCQKP